MNEAASLRVNVRTLMVGLGIVALIVVLLSAMQVIAVKLIVALILARGIAPVADAFGPRARPSWRWHPSRALVVFLAFFTAFGVMLVLGGAIAATVTVELQQLLADLPSYGQRLDAELQTFLASNPNARTYLDQIDLRAHLAGLSQQVLGLFSNALVLASRAAGVALGVLDVLMVMLFTVYLASDGGLIRDYLLGFLRPEHRPMLVRVTNGVGERLGAWVRGQLLLCLAIGVITWVGLVALGVPYPALLAIVAGVFEALPTIGPVIAAVPSVLLTLALSPGRALAVMVLYLVIQALENNVLVPRIMGASVSLHPLVVLVALTVGQELFGVTGAILAVPIAAAVAVVVDELRATRIASFVPIATDDAPPAQPRIGAIDPTPVADG